MSVENEIEQVLHIGVGHSLINFRGNVEMVDENGVEYVFKSCTGNEKDGTKIVIEKKSDNNGT